MLFDPTAIPRIRHWSLLGAIALLAIKSVVVAQLVGWARIVLEAGDVIVLFGSPDDVQRAESRHIRIRLSVASIALILWCHRRRVRRKTAIG